MRQGQGAKRSRGRNNGRRNAPARMQNYDSNGPSVRIRGNAYQVHEKYLQLARDAHSAGDRIMTENYYQHAEHYLRIINADLAEAERNGQSVGPMPGQSPQHQGGNGNEGQRGRGRLGNGNGNGEDHAGQSDMQGGQDVEYGFDGDDDMDGDEDGGPDDRRLDPADAEQPVIEPASMTPVAVRGTGTGG